MKSDLHSNISLWPPGSSLWSALHPLMKASRRPLRHCVYSHIQEEPRLRQASASNMTDCPRPEHRRGIHFSATTGGAMLHFQLAGMGPFSGRPVTAQTKQETNTEVSMRLTCSMWSVSSSGLAPALTALLPLPPWRPCCWTSSSGPMEVFFVRRLGPDGYGKNPKSRLLNMSFLWFENICL